eukprot:gene4677-9270_t
MDLFGQLLIGFTRFITFTGGEVWGVGVLYEMDIQPSPTDNEIIEAVTDALSKGDLLSFTKKSLREQIENLYGWNLRNHKDIINATLEAFIEKHNNLNAGQEVEDEVDNDDDNLDKCDEAEAEAEIDEEDNDEEADEKFIPIIKKKRGGFGAEVQLSDELNSFFGVITMSRTDVTKGIWEYIKKNNLQNPANKREIVSDETFMKIFKKKKFDMFAMTKMLSKKSPQTKKRKSTSTSTSTKVKDEEDGTGVTKTKAVSSGGRGAVFNATMQLSSGLSKILGEDQLSRPQVVSKMWVYIKEHDLQNPSDKREIILNEPLAKLFKTDRVTMFSINKHLSEHITKIPEETK